MVTSTGLELLQKFSEGIFDWEPRTTTADGNSAKDTLVDAGLRNLDGGGDPDAFENWYVRIADSNSAADQEIRRVKSYSPVGSDGDSPTLQVEQPFTGGQIKSGESYELHRYNPTLKRTTINRSIRELYPTLYLPIRDESITIDNLLANQGFEDWNSALNIADNWTNVNSPTVSRESTNVFHASFSAKIVGPSGNVGQLTQAPAININEVTGLTATFKARVRTNAASQARLRLDFDGSSITNGNYHSGDNHFELLSVSTSIPAAATQVKCICEVTADDTAYFDRAYLLIKPLYEYTLPSSMISLPHYVEEQYDEDNVIGNFFPFKENAVPTSGKLLRVTGMGALSQPSSDTATIEVGEPQTDLIAAYAKMLFWRQMASPARSAQHERKGYMDAAQDARQEVADLAAKPGMKTRRMGSGERMNTWHTEANASGNILVFERARI
jgi:hypothetical protein